MTSPTNFSVARVRDSIALTVSPLRESDELEPVFSAADLAAVADELTRDRWRLTRFELTGHAGVEPELAHAEAYRSILAYDLATGGPAKVSATLETELSNVCLTGIRASKTFQQADHFVIVRASGQVITDTPEPVRELLIAACPR